VLIVDICIASHFECVHSPEPPNKHGLINCQDLKRILVRPPVDTAMHMHSNEAERAYLAATRKFSTQTAQLINKVTRPSGTGICVSTSITSHSGVHRGWTPPNDTCSSPISPDLAALGSKHPLTHPFAAPTEITRLIAVVQKAPSSMGPGFAPASAAASCSIVQLQRAMRSAPNWD
jgi:hypothetical protein